ncbi:MAG: cytochrome C oxidase subunit IV family protein [Porticoccaceae bacterium]|nr:cytochrome C oxidase subunit IV family protein [Porticoccaceae bacterium]
MRDVVGHYTTWIWLLLVALTTMSWEVGDGGASAGIGTSLVTPLLLLVAFFKVRLVGLHFMELKTAPLPLRILFESWVAAVCGLLLLIYFQVFQVH